MNFKLSLISTALLTSFSVSAFAETEQPVKANTETLEQINVQDTGIKQNGYQTTGTSVVSKAEVPVFDTPNTVNILSTKLLEDRKPESLIDALYNVSGVSQANTLGGMFDAIQKRGFGGNRDNSIMRKGLQAGPARPNLRKILVVPFRIFRCGSFINREYTIHTMKGGSYASA